MIYISLAIIAPTKDTAGTGVAGYGVGRRDRFYPSAAHLRHSGSCANIRFRGFRYLRVGWIFMFLEVFCLQ